MGYKVSRLDGLPRERGAIVYVFLVGEATWPGALEEEIGEKFDKLAREVGPNAVIVGALEPSLHDEIAEAYFGAPVADLEDHFPGLLITDSHPDDATEDSLRLVAPYDRSEQLYESVSGFLTDLVAYVRGESNALAERLDATPTPRDVLKSIEVHAPIVPGFISVDARRLLQMAGELRRRWHSKRNR